MPARENDLGRVTAQGNRRVEAVARGGDRSEDHSGHITLIDLTVAIRINEWSDYRRRIRAESAVQVILPLDLGQPIANRWLIFARAAAVAVVVGLVKLWNLVRAVDKYIDYVVAKLDDARCAQVQRCRATAVDVAVESPCSQRVVNASFVGAIAVAILE